MKHLKIGYFHAFLKNKGGAEKVAMDICNYYQADFIVGGFRPDLFGPEKKDPFNKTLYNDIPFFDFLHVDAKIPVWRHIKRQLFFLFSPKIKDIAKYDVVLFSGNVFWVQQRLRRINPDITLITYCHTPPRTFSDQKKQVLDRINPLLRPLYNWFAACVLYFFKQTLISSDVLMANSQNIQKRIEKYLMLESILMFPPVETDRFEYISEGDFYLSHSRLEDMKRIRQIVETFKDLPDQKLVICSIGPLKEWVEREVANNPLHNIEYRGLVSDDELAQLVGTCKAGIIIPIEEDAGIVQCEIMAAGKPVLGVAEGGLLETVVHKQTGYLVPSDPTNDDLKQGIAWLDQADTTSMKQDCIDQAKKFDRQVFFDKLTDIISNSTSKK
jgi:glycosyltransferase involved in cell wall biosynthesis